MTTLLTLANDPAYYHGGWFFFPFFWFFGFLFLIFVLRGLFWRRRWRHYHRPWGWVGGENDPRAILAARYARGEIDESEYRQRLSVLNAPDTPSK